MDKPLTRAIEAAGGAAALARICGQLPQAVTRWKREGRPPAKHCLAIEAATGVTRYELRPDVFGGSESARRSSAANEGGAAEAVGVPVQPLKEAA